MLHRVRHTFDTGGKLVTSAVQRCESLLVPCPALKAAFPTADDSPLTVHRLSGVSLIKPTGGKRSYTHHTVWACAWGVLAVPRCF